jgi:ElaB/YqjD/DUF883 family membrane-anchored ribosome-binding protein
MANAGDKGGTNPGQGSHPRMAAGLPQGPGGGQGTGGTMSQMASEVGGRVGDAWETASRGVRQGYEAVAGQARDFWADAIHLVRRNPMAAVGIAFGVGCLVGCCLAAGMAYSTEDIPDRMSRASA